MDRYNFDGYDHEVNRTPPARRQPPRSGYSQSGERRPARPPQREGSRVPARRAPSQPRMSNPSRQENMVRRRSNQIVQGEQFDLNNYSKKGKKKRRNVKRIVINTVSIVVIMLSLTYICAVGMLSAKPFRGEGAGEGSYKPAVNQNEDVKYFLVTGVDKSESLTDVILVACLDIKKQELNVLQIPRDTFVGTEDSPTGKINSVYSNPREGERNIDALIRKINSHFGLPIDHYVVINIEAFNEIVDALGGITVDVPTTVSYEGVTVYPGEQLLNGKQAETFMRVRSSYAMGDIGRVQAQRCFFIGLFNRLKDVSTGDLLSVYNACKDDIITEMSWDDMLTYANKIRKLNMEDVGIYGVPGESFYFGEQSCYSVHMDELLTMLNDHFDPYGLPITEEDIYIQEMANTLGYSQLDTGGSISDMEDGEYVATEPETDGGEGE